jgi:hypothetical protein
LETRSHLTIFWQTFFVSIFLITIIYSVIARTKRMKWQNKREQMSEQVYMSSRTTNVCQNKSEQESDTCYYCRQNKITTYYYS